MTLACKAVKLLATKFLDIVLSVTMPYKIWNEGLLGTHEIQSLSMGLALSSIVHYQTENPEIHKILNVSVHLVFFKNWIEIVLKEYFNNTIDIKFNY